jgi:light-independent protochlorophyllide reductase subunit L
MDDSPELALVQDEYLGSRKLLWAVNRTARCAPMKDRDIFDFLGFD